MVPIGCVNRDVGSPKTLHYPPSGVSVKIDIFGDEKRLSCPWSGQWTKEFIVVLDHMKLIFDLNSRITVLQILYLHQRYRNMETQTILFSLK